MNTSPPAHRTQIEYSRIVHDVSELELIDVAKSLRLAPDALLKAILDYYVDELPPCWLEDYLLSIHRQWGYHASDEEIDRITHWIARQAHRFCVQFQDLFEDPRVRAIDLSIAGSLALITVMRVTDLSEAT